MVRPLTRALPTGARSLFAIACGFLLCLPPAGAPRAADEDEGGTVLGTFEIGGAPASASRPAWPARGRGPAGAGAAARSVGEPDAAELYEEALSELEAGQEASAQRLFEMLISRDPDSDLAAKARRHLAKLYRGERPEESPAADAGKTRSDLAAAPWLSPDREMQFILEAGDRVFFGSGTSDLGSRARGVLVAQARWLKQHPGLEVTIEGYADDAPLSEEQQIELAQARAEAVRERLVGEGIETRRLQVVAFGREKRIAGCDDPRCAAQNRRVVTALTPRGTRSSSLGLDSRSGHLPMAAGGPRPRAQ